MLTPAAALGLEERGIEEANTLAALAGLALLCLKISRGRANLRDFKERKRAGGLRDVLHTVRGQMSRSMRTYSLQYADIFLAVCGHIRSRMRYEDAEASA